MRTYISLDRGGWPYRLDYKKLILIAFLLRFIFAAIYDISVSVTGKERILPDGKLYSTNGWYVAFLLNGFYIDPSWKDNLPLDAGSKKVFFDTLIAQQGKLPRERNETTLFYFVVATVYTIFGYFPLAMRTFNISLSIASTYFIFRIAGRQINEVTANIFLSIALFLPTQVIYSITLSRDFLRMFVISLFLWAIYGGVICLRKRVD